MNKTLSTDQTPENIASVLDVLTETPDRLERLSQSVPAEKFRQPLGKDERTPTEVLAHMINGEARSAEMIYQALLVHEPLFADFHPDRNWGKLTRFDLLDFSELLVYFIIRRKVLLRVLSKLKEKDWERGIREEGRKYPESIYKRARSLVMHELDHMADLETKLEKFRK
jgi:hypothetical protein